MSSSKGLRRGSLLLSLCGNLITSFSDGLALYSYGSIKHYWEYNVERKIHIVGNSLKNPTSINTSANKKSRIMFIGSLHPRKGILSLIKGFDKSLKGDNQLPDDIKLIIVGEGPEREVIETYIFDNGLDNKVLLLALLFSLKDRLEKKYDVTIMIFLVFILCFNVFGLNQYIYRLLQYLTPFLFVTISLVIARAALFSKLSRIISLLFIIVSGVLAVFILIR